MSQLVELNVPVNRINGGWATFTLAGWGGSADGTDGGEVRIRFANHARALLKGWHTTGYLAPNEGVWEPFSLSGPVPPSAKYAQIVLVCHAINKGSRYGFDDIRLSITHPV